MPRLPALLTLLAALLLAPATARAQGDPPASPPMPGQFEQIGHNPLMYRGMNAALAVHRGYAYVGSRTDGTHVNAGVMVVDVRDPTAPTIVKEIGPTEGEGLPTQTSREMRILPDQNLLIILNHQCNELIHRCVAPSNAGVGVLPSNFKVFDIAGENAANPKLIATIEPSAQGPQTPHEFFMWNDPKQPGRVLMYYSDPGGDDGEVIVADWSKAREGTVTEIAKFAPEANGNIHSMSVSHDGRKLFLAALTGGYLVADTSEVAEGRPNPQIKQVTPADAAPMWEGPGAHSAVALPGRPGRVMITDEVYGNIPLLLADHGCPWGWVRFIDDSQPAAPQVISEYKLPVNDPAYCDQVTPDRNSTSSWAAHNPTLTENLAILSWHSAGLQAIDTTNPAAPTGAAEFRPEPLPAVQTEDPALSSGRDKVVMWSFPTIVDGLIYMVDLRNGLYILRYKGPHEQEVARTKFLDGASNSGDYGRMELRGGGGGGGGGGGNGGDGTARPDPCLPSPLRITRSGLGPFKLGEPRNRTELQGGRSPASVRRRALAYCVQGGSRAVIAFDRRGRAALLAATGRVLGAPRGLTPGQRFKRYRRMRRAGGGFWIARQNRSSVAVSVKAGRVRWIGLVSGRPGGRALRSLARAGGL